MPSVGPFELTEAEFIGLEFLRQEDERQLRKTTLRATWLGRELNVKADPIWDVAAMQNKNIDSRSLVVEEILP